jgi:cysteine desulfurase
MRRVFLDNQSTTPVLPEVFEAMRPYFIDYFGNPSSLHEHGLRVRDAIAAARTKVASLINAESSEEVYFTSGGTESANLAVKGVAYANQRRGNHIVVSAIEHPAVLNSVEFLLKQGFTCSRVPVDAEGRVDPEAVRARITNQTVLVAVHHVNHDIATIEPIQEIAVITQERGIPLFVDAVASAGWLPIDVQQLGASLLSLAPHRFYGPKGVGVLYRNRSARVLPILHGGSQEAGLRAGTENVPAIVGAGVAAELAARDQPIRAAHIATLQQRLWTRLHARVPFLKLNGPVPGRRRSPTNLNVSVEFVEGEGLLLICDTRGLALASGTSCVSKSLKASHVLEAIGLDHALAQGAVLMSLGQDNTEEEIDSAVEVFASAVDRLRSLSPTWDEFQKGTVDSIISPKPVPPN